MVDSPGDHEGIAGQILSLSAALPDEAPVRDAYQDIFATWFNDKLYVQRIEELMQEI